MINDQNNQHQMTNIFEGNSLEIRAAAEQQLPSIQELKEQGKILVKLPLCPWPILDMKNLLRVLRKIKYHLITNSYILVHVDALSN